MAAIQSKTLDLTGISISGQTMLSALTASKEWAETTLQYALGGDADLSWSSEFRPELNSTFSGAADSSFFFTTLTDRAFLMIDTVSNLDFVNEKNSSTTDLLIVSVNKPSSSIEGFFDFPGTFQAGTNDFWSLGAFNHGPAYMRTAAELGGGAYANWTIIHEIGHSLDLKHTHNESTGAALASVGKFMDNERYSVMSYHGASAGEAFGHAVTMMALDVASMQALYGAESYAGISSSYSMVNARGGALSLAENDVQIGRAYYCIWDSNGTDKIDYANSGHSVLINLNDATLNTTSIASDVAEIMGALKATTYFSQLATNLKLEITDKWHHAGGFFSRVLDNVNGLYKGEAGGYSIAHGVMIENAQGGDMADLLIGNEGNNVLTGNGGKDTLLGSGGSDTLNGNDGADRLDGGTGNDFLVGGAGNDRFVYRTTGGQDEISDFVSGDKIDLSA